MRDLRGRSADEHEHRVIARGCDDRERIEKEVDSLIALEIPGVDDRSPLADLEARAEGGDARSVGRAQRLVERAVLDLRDRHPRLDRVDGIGERRAHRDRELAPAQRRALHATQQTEKRAALDATAVRQLIGERRVHVVDHRNSAQPRSGEREEHRLLDRMHDVEALAGDPRPRRERERRIERDLSPREADRHAAHTRDRHGAMDVQPRNRNRLAHWIRCEMHFVAGLAQRLRHLPHVDGRAALREERLRRDQQDAHRRLAHRAFRLVRWRADSDDCGRVHSDL